jgi:hypothetical protein
VTSFLDKDFEKILFSFAPPGPRCQKPCTIPSLWFDSHPLTDANEITTGGVGSKKGKMREDEASCRVGDSPVGKGTNKVSVVVRYIYVVGC